MLSWKKASAGAWSRNHRWMLLTGLLTVTCSVTFLIHLSSSACTFIQLIVLLTVIWALPHPLVISPMWWWWFCNRSFLFPDCVSLTITNQYDWFTTFKALLLWRIICFCIRYKPIKISWATISFWDNGRPSVWQYWLPLLYFSIHYHPLWSYSTKCWLLWLGLREIMLRYRQWHTPIWLLCGNRSLGTMAAEACK